jgi:hypothetical protein
VAHDRRREHRRREAKSSGKVMEAGTYPCDVSPVRCEDSGRAVVFRCKWTSAVADDDIEGIL